MKFLSNKAILLLIMLVAVATRFYQLTEIPFTHDEFSALFRTAFDSFNELIDKGVRVDGHPAGIQVFLYYWTNLFGTAGWIVKLPFLIFGVLSVWLVFLIGRRWYNETVGLLAAAFMATLQYPVMYSQIARPYVSGLFFTLLMVWFWTSIIKQSQVKFWPNAIGLILASTLCAYNHHFSLLMVGIVWASGLFLIRKDYLVKYIVSGLTVVLLYLPHIGILLDQLKMGGVEGWLGKPDNDFLLKYVGYIFHFDWMLMIVVGLLVISAYFLRGFQWKPNYKFWLFLSWFLLPFFIGFLYSMYINAVLQFSVLIFSFPFLFFVLFGHLKKQKFRINLAMVLVVLAFGLFTLIEKRQHYTIFYNSIHQHVITDNPQTDNRKSTVLAIINADKEITNYYQKKYDLQTDYIWYDQFSDEGDFISFLRENKNRYKRVYFGGLSSSSSVIVPIIQNYYPQIVWHKTYFGGDTYLFSGGNKSERNVIAEMGFESKKQKGWRGIKQKGLTKQEGDSINIVYQMLPKMEWGPNYTLLLDTVLTNPNNFVDATIEFRSTEVPEEMLFVVNVKSGENSIFWKARSFDQFVYSNDSVEWHKAYHSVKLSDIRLKGDDLHVRFSLWNKGENSIWLDNFVISHRNGNPKIYGLIQPLR